MVSREQLPPICASGLISGGRNGTCCPLRRGRNLNRSNALAEKLGIGSTFPSLTLNLVGGGTLSLPDGLDTNYKVILFYRGHW